MKKAGVVSKSGSHMDWAKEYGEQRWKAHEGSALRYHRGEFHSWTGTHYRKVPRRDVESDALRWLDAQGRTAKVKVAKEIVDCLAAISMVPSHVTQPQWLNEDAATDPKSCISMKNGILDIKRLLGGDTNALRPLSSCFFAGTSLPYVCDPDAQCPRWLQFLGEVLEDDAQRIALLQEWLGYNLISDTSFHKFLLIVGEGANGKSVFLDVLEALIGAENVAHTGLDVLGKQFQLTPIIGKLANIVPEVSDLAKTDEAVLKAIVSGDGIQVDRKNRDPIPIRPTARMTIATNTLPLWADRSEGLWRRMLVVPFRIAIPEHQQDRGLARYIREHELPGVFQWAIRGLLRLLSVQQFTIPAVSLEVMAEYRREANPARAFLHDECSLDPAATLSFFALYQAYRHHCEERGSKPLPEASFGKDIRRVYPDVTRCQRRVDGRRMWVLEGLTCKAIDSAE